jgi:hypothetical protein
VQTRVPMQVATRLKTHSLVLPSELLRILRGIQVRVRLGADPQKRLLLSTTLASRMIRGFRGQAGVRPLMSAGGRLMARPLDRTRGDTWPRRPLSDSASHLRNLRMT